MDVRLELANDETRQIVRNQFTAYFFDLSQYDDNLIINQYGLPWWAPSGPPGPRTHDECARMNWWVRDDCQHYIIRAGAVPAGFTIICDDPRHLAPGVDFELMDFYIAPKYRRVGVGRRAARLAFDTRRGGTWQVFQLARNAPALRFWHGVIAEYTGGRYESLDNGTQQRFRV